MSTPTRKELRARGVSNEPVTELELRVKLLEEKVEYLLHQLVMLGAMHRWTHEAADGGLFGLTCKPAYEAIEVRAGVLYQNLFGKPPACPWPKLDKLVKERQARLRKKYRVEKEEVKDDGEDSDRSE